jgi:hypothetical protein
VSLRVVLYGEGGRDVGGERPPPSPGVRLAENDLGPAHILVRRAVSRTRQLPESAVLFEAGLRIRSHVHRASQLLQRDCVRQLCTWAISERAPQLVVVLVDEDEDKDRRATLQEHVAGTATTVVVAIAVREFESWLVADARAASDACGRSVSVPEEIEDLPRREAKERLQTWIAAQDQRRDRDIRCAIAAQCDLDLLAKRCPSFGVLVSDLTRSASR